MAPTNPAACLGAIGWPGFSWEGVERTSCEPTIPQSFSKYRSDGEPGSGCVFQMWNNSRSAIRYTWGKISDCHIVEVEPCTGTIGTAGAEVGAGWGRRAGGERGLCRGPWPPDQLQPQPGPVVGKEYAKARYLSPATEGTCPCFLSPRLTFPLPLSEPSEVEDFQLNFTGGVPGPTSQSLLCEIKDSPSPVVLHVEAAFKVPLVGLGGWAGWTGSWGRAQSPRSGWPGDRPLWVPQGPALVIDVSALQFGLLRLGQRATNSIQIDQLFVV